MRMCKKATSRLIFVENEDKLVSLIVEECNVASFNGMDYETIYILS